MSEFEDIQRLIRLKRFEQPDESFTEDFLREFHQRQREEMLKRSSVELFWERATTWWNNILAPKWSLAGVAAAACIAGVWLFSAGKSAPEVTTVPAPVPAIPEKPFIPKMDLSELPMANMAERNNAKLEESILRKHLQITPVLESSVTPLPAGANGLEAPKSKNVIPAGAANGK